MSFIYSFFFFVAPGLQMGTDWELANWISYQFIVMEPGRNTSSHRWRNSTALASARCLNRGWLWDRFSFYMYDSFNSTLDPATVPL